MGIKWNGIDWNKTNGMESNGMESSHHQHRIEQNEHRPEWSHPVERDPSDPGINF